MRDFASLGNNLIDLALRVFHAIRAADKTAFLFDENLPGQGDDIDQISLVGLRFHFAVKMWSITRAKMGSLRIALKVKARQNLRGGSPDCQLLAI
jgi:hypothetical protein